MEHPITGWEKLRLQIIQANNREITTDIPELIPKYLNYK